MTTAHRPTYNAAVGKAADYGNWSTGGKVSGQFSALDLPGHTKLKFRQAEQLPQVPTREGLEQAEAAEAQVKAQGGKAKAAALAITDGSGGGGGLASSKALTGATKLLLKDVEIDLDRLNKKYDDRDEEAEEESDLDTSSDEEEEDEEELLRLELEKIKREREETRKQREAEEAAIEAKAKGDAAMLGNPLLNPGSSAMKRKWNDDVVFKNQARSGPETKKRFVNDTIRNDFHRKFLGKYIT